MNDPERIKARIGWLKEALAVIEPYHGRHVRRIAEWADVRQRLDSLPGAGQGYLMSSWFLDHSGATKVDVSGALRELANQEKALAAALAAQADPRFRRLHELETALRTEWAAVRSALSPEDYNAALRAGAFPRITWH